MRYFISMFNDKTKNIIGEHSAFDEGGIATRSRYCAVRMHNKDKPRNYRAVFFILENATYYFIDHIEV